MTNCEDNNNQATVLAPFNMEDTAKAATDRQTVAEFYANKSVFVTGGTGFLGTVLIEALLSTTPDIGRIYVLVRGKRGDNAEQRLQKLLSKQVRQECVGWDGMGGPNSGMCGYIRSAIASSSNSGNEKVNGFTVFVTVADECYEARNGFPRRGHCTGTVFCGPVRVSRRPPFIRIRIHLGVWDNDVVSFVNHLPTYVVDLRWAINVIRDRSHTVTMNMRFRSQIQFPWFVIESVANDALTRST